MPKFWRIDGGERCPLDEQDFSDRWSRDEAEAEWRHWHDEEEGCDPTHEARIDLIDNERCPGIPPEVTGSRHGHAPGCCGRSMGYGEYPELSSACGSRMMRMREESLCQS